MCHYHVELLRKLRKKEKHTKNIFTQLPKSYLTHNSFLINFYLKGLQTYFHVTVKNYDLL